MKLFLRLIAVVIVGFTILTTSAGTLVQFRTSVGDLEVELFDEDKPVTAQNFLRYVRTGAYKDMFIHRWAPNFVFQGGGFWVTNRFNTNRTVEAVSSFGQITNEYRTGRTFSNVYGTIAMARVGGQTNSATSQWFFNVAANTDLDTADGGFTVFGKVVQGTNVLELFRAATTNNGIFRYNVGSPFNELPALISRVSSAAELIPHFIYVDITVIVRLTIRSIASGRREISWNSVNNAIHHVDFTTVLPPNWQVLTSTNGNGNTLSVIDSSPDPARIYRVRVDF